MNNNLPPGTHDWDEDAPWNMEDYEYEVTNIQIIRDDVQVSLNWKGLPAGKEEYYPQLLTIDMEDIHELIDSKIGR